MSKYVKVGDAEHPDFPNQQGFVENKPDDIAKAGQFAIAGDTSHTDDFTQKPGAKTAFGRNLANFVLSGGMVITIHPPIRVYRGADSKMFELMTSSPQVVEITPSDPVDDRIDVIYVQLEEDVDAGQETRHITLNPRDPEAAQGDVQVFMEKHNRVTLHVAIGTPTADPVRPTLPAGTAAAYDVFVPAGATQLSEDNIIDVRHQFLTQEELDEELALLKETVNDLKDNNHRHPADNIDVGPGNQWAGKSVQDALNDISNITDTDTFDLITHPETLTPTLAPSHANSGKLNSVGDVASGISVVDTPIEYLQIAFSNVIRLIETQKFPADVDARIVTKAGAADTHSTNIPLTLAGIQNIQTDGVGDLSLQTYAMPAARVKQVAGGKLASARDNRYIEVFGGAYPAGNSAWSTIDTVAETVTARTFDGDIPANAIIFSAPTGDGRILIAERGGADNTTAGSTLRWYLVNPATNDSEYLAGGPADVVGPSTLQYPGVIGDLVQPNVIVLAVAGEGIPNINWYAFKVDTEQFELLATIGQAPVAFSGAQRPQRLRDIDACILDQGKLAVIEAHSTIRTFIFDYPTRTFTTLNISQPTVSYQRGHKGISVANFNGRVTLLAENMKVWQLQMGTVPRWSALDTGLDTNIFGTRGLAGAVALLTGGLPRDKGLIIGGIETQSQVARSPKGDIWKFVPSGIVETICDGVTALTLGPGATQGSFVLPTLNLPWQVAKVLFNAVGHFENGQLRVAYSLDDSANFQDVTRGVLTNVINSSNPAIRALRITLIGTSTSKPCISSISEVFHKTGAVGVQQVLRYNARLNATHALVLNRDGSLELTTVVAKGTPDRALLHKVTPNGAGVAPTVKNYINKRLIHFLIDRTHAGSDPSAPNELPRDYSFAHAFKIVGSAYQSYATPAIVFDADINFVGLTIGQSVKLEVEA
jgi:hypothetical protein